MDIPSASVLLNNSGENQFFGVLDEFLDRQLFLNSSVTVALNWKYDSDIDFSHVYYDTSNALAFHRYGSRIKPDSLDEIERHKNLFFLTLVAQSVESIETFLKECINEILKSKLGESATLLRDKFRTNKERFTFLATYCDEIRTYFEGERYSNHCKSYLMIEHVRHATVHSKQMITKRNKNIDVSSELFKLWFTLDDSSGLNTIKVSAEKTSQVFVVFSDLAFMIFECLSKKHNCPIVRIPAHTITRR